MKNSDELLAARAKAVFTPNYQPAPLVLCQGNGCYVTDASGRRFLDMVSGIAVSALGHGHPRLLRAIEAQVGRILHTSNLYLNEPSVTLAEKLVAHSFADAVYFCNSGAEANEAAIKLARRFAHQKGEPERTEILSFAQSFHGRTYGALAATGQPKYHEGFGPMPLGFRHAPLNDEAALEAAVSNRTAAILVEPIQGEGGVRAAKPAFLKLCRRLADAHQALLIFDEVQVGVGRTGTMFCHEHDGVVPHIMTLAKGLGGGLPLGAMVAAREVAGVLVPGTHATTFGGNPVACAAGNVVLDVISEPGFLERVRQLGARLAEGLESISRELSVFSEVRGRGLLVGAELRPEVPFDAKAVVLAARDRGVLVHLAGPRVVRLVPPLVVEAKEVDAALDVLKEVLAELGSSELPP